MELFSTPGPDYYTCFLSIYHEFRITYLQHRDNMRGIAGWNIFLLRLDPADYAYVNIESSHVAFNTTTATSTKIANRSHASTAKSCPIRLVTRLLPRPVMRDAAPRRLCAPRPAKMRIHSVVAIRQRRRLQ